MAGQKGDTAVAQDREHMSRIGRVGGQATKTRSSKNKATKTQ